MRFCLIVLSTCLLLSNSNLVAEEKARAHGPVIGDPTSSKPESGGQSDLSLHATNTAFKEIHELLAERTRITLKLTYLRKNRETADADGSKLQQSEDRLSAIKDRLEHIHETNLSSFERVAEDASLATAEEPMFGQPSYGIILFATSVKDIAAHELLLFHGKWIYRTNGEFISLRSPGEGWYFQPNVDIPSGTRFVVACHQDAPEEIENVNRGFMPNSDRAREPSRPYRTEIFGRDGKPLERFPDIGTDPPSR